MYYIKMALLNPKYLLFYNLQLMEALTNKQWLVILVGFIYKMIFKKTNTWNQFINFYML